jgi:alkylation response protein AidB-like acyl-CoA dehydrogenase
VCERSRRKRLAFAGLSSPAVDFGLTADQREIQALARDFARAEIEPHAAQWDRDHYFPRDLYTKLAELGLMGVCVPEEYGGAGADFLSYVLVLEELSRADAGVGVTVAVHTSAVTLPILAFGTDEQRSRFAPPLARGEAIGAFALTEPGSGSDAGSLRTRAEPDGDGWRLSGQKTFISTARYAGTLVLFARTDPDSGGARGVSAFILDADHVRVTRDEDKLGLNSSVTNDLVLEDAHVARDRLLGDENRGFRVAMSTLDGGRIGIAAHALGIAQAAYDVARSYALERRQFGKRIADFQAIQWKLADMSMEIDAARLLVYRAAWLKEQGEPHAEAGAKAKLYASEMARRQTAEAIQVLGGYGYTKEFPVERYYRDAKVTEIYEGTSEIQRIVIARSILGLAERPLAART